MKPKLTQGTDAIVKRLGRRLQRRIANVKADVAAVEHRFSRLLNPSLPRTIAERLYESDTQDPVNAFHAKIDSLAANVAETQRAVGEQIQAIDIRINNLAGVAQPPGSAVLVQIENIHEYVSTQAKDLRTNMDALATGTDRLQGRVTVLEQLNKQRSDEVAVLLEKCSTLQDRIDTLEEIVAKPAPQTSVRDCTVTINQGRE